MTHDPIIFALFLIFAGAAVIATIVLYTRQSLLVAYMLLGAMLGPWGLNWFSDSMLVSQVGNVGIIFLLFLMGLSLKPSNLFKMLQKTTIITLISSLIFLFIGFLLSRLFGYTWNESLLVGAAMMFSSTIIGIKLLPTTILHHQHTGEVMISILLMQDIIAIIVLLILHGLESGGFHLVEFIKMLFALPLLLGIAFLGTRFFLLRLIRRFDRIQEYIFLISIAWCLSMGILADELGLSAEIGAFIAGVSLATNPVSIYIAESLKPLRDFFLIMFFFAIGASFNIHYFPQVIIPACVLAAAMLIAKPWVFRFLLIRVGEVQHIATEIAFRLGQLSEFSLLITYLALNTFSGKQLIASPAAYLIQAATIVTFIVSSYVVIFRYPTPIALSDKLRRD
ncbi:MAG: cation:proton antiporter [Legionellales bacterium]|nr:cation:proton antiporter [Legionellales bacterium]